MNEDLSKLNIDMSSKGVNPALLEEFIKGLKGVDGAEEYLRESMAEDVKTYFNASTPMEQLLAKGAYFRMKWLLGQLQKVGDKTKTSPMKIGRYVQ